MKSTLTIFLILGMVSHANAAWLRGRSARRMASQADNCQPGQPCAINSRGGITGTAPPPSVGTATPGPPRTTTQIVTRPRQRSIVVPTKADPQADLNAALATEADLLRRYRVARQQRVFKQKLALAAKDKEIEQLISSQKIAVMTAHIADIEAKAKEYEAELRNVRELEQLRDIRGQLQSLVDQENPIAPEE